MICSVGSLRSALFFRMEEIGIDLMWNQGVETTASGREMQSDPLTRDLFSHSVCSLSQFIHTLCVPLSASQEAYVNQTKRQAKHEPHTHIHTYNIQHFLAQQRFHPLHTKCIHTACLINEMEIGNDELFSCTRRWSLFLRKKSKKSSSKRTKAKRETSEMRTTQQQQHEKAGTHYTHYTHRLNETVSFKLDIIKSMEIRWKKLRRRKKRWSLHIWLPHRVNQFSKKEDKTCKLWPTCMP